MKGKMFAYVAVMVIILIVEGLIIRACGITASYVESLSTGQYVIYMICLAAYMAFNYGLATLLGKLILR